MGEGERAAAKAQLGLVCPMCRREADAELKLNGKPVCRVCAHNASHSRPLGANFATAIPKFTGISVKRWDEASDTRGAVEIACPVTDGKGNVIPWGIYPNIDWS